jgi:3-phenylpropionate/trans-cinnamate dioxygenase ferredoxin reductase subunit
MLGKPASYEEIPYFFSDQYDVSMEYTGYGTDWDEVVFRGNVEESEFIAFWLKDQRLLAGMNVNIWDQSEPIAELIRSQRPLDRADLADPDVPLSELVEPEPAEIPQEVSAWASEGGSL